MLAMAGVWAPVHLEGPTAAILTTSPNALVAPIHNRMPVILDLDALEAWLDPSAEPAVLSAMLAPAPTESLRMWPVSTAVNKVDTDGPELLRPVEPAPSLGLV